MKSQGEAIYKTKLNLGSGDDIRAGWINMDSAHPKADLKWDMLDWPWPIDSEQLEYVLASHVLEHIPLPDPFGNVDPFLQVMAEIHRVLKPGGVLEVAVPLAGTHTDYSFFQHYRRFTKDSFHVFDPARFGMEPWYTPVRFKVISAKLESLGHCSQVWKMHVRDRLPFTRGMMEEKTGLRFVLVKP